ncbi:hypothetical protein E2C01_087144 [Portunus trituberculatus]|uniref:Uncharacterized protein n=1 Tax=Portunus trituberculatus TaxID=210409 RepID=A0A5B7J7C9_PORTR|nr:hypothetical protein [Portunus trituberculatus]
MAFLRLLPEVSGPRCVDSLNRGLRNPSPHTGHETDHPSTATLPSPFIPPSPPATTPYLTPSLRLSWDLTSNYANNRH